jgi:hypothetical protein
MFDKFPQLYYRGNVVTGPPNRGTQLMLENHCLLENPEDGKARSPIRRFELVLHGTKSMKTC